MRFLPVNPTTLLVELADLEATLALFDSLARKPLEGVEEIIPAARTLMLRFDPETSASDIAAELGGPDA